VRKHKEQNKLPAEMKKKLDYIYNRITSQKARLLARRWYEAALEELEK